jgi:hypothetical protein
MIIPGRECRLVALAAVVLVCLITIAPASTQPAATQDFYAQQRVSVLFPSDEIELPLFTPLDLYWT